jgi:hypothetical protein
LKPETGLPVSGFLMQNLMDPKKIVWRLFLAFSQVIFKQNPVRQSKGAGCGEKFFLCTVFGIINRCAE